VTDEPRPKTSNARRLAGLALLLLIVAVGVNIKTALALMRHERTLKGVILGIQGDKEPEFANLILPRSIGSENAKVTVEVFVQGGRGCHADTVFTGEALGTIDPERIRVVFRDTRLPEAMKRFAALKVGCEQGMAVNGKVKFDMPVSHMPNSGAPKASPDTKGTKEHVVYLTGGHGEHWGMDVLHSILDRELKALYGGKGMKMDVAQFTQSMTDAKQRAMDKAREENRQAAQAAGA